MIITNSAPEDLDVIQQLFDEAIRYQRSRSAKAWHGMNRELIENEIRERMHWKIVEEEQIACFFSAIYQDRMVWDERDLEPSIYLHRIVTNPAFRGRGYVRHIVAWAEEYGKATGKRYIRLDTHRDNQRLNAYYRECGFVFCGTKQFHDGLPGIPCHYLGPGLSLYEKPIA
jgi:ribosomal protein S18 acetylase RimI-like enzyme